LTIHDDGIVVDEDLEVAGGHEDHNRNYCCGLGGMNRICRTPKVPVMVGRWDMRTARRHACWEAESTKLGGRGMKQTETYLARLSTDRSSPTVEGI
jgi:hypothetical protein